MHKWMRFLRNCVVYYTNWFEIRRRWGSLTPQPERVVDRNRSWNLTETHNFTLQNRTNKKRGKKIGMICHSSRCGSLAAAHLINFAWFGVTPAITKVTFKYRTDWCLSTFPSASCWPCILNKMSGSQCIQSFVSTSLAGPRRTVQELSEQENQRTAHGNLYIFFSVRSSPSQTF